MPIEIIIPRLGWSMEEGNFVNWLKKDGEGVKSGELLFSLENEKAVQEVEAIDSGMLRIPPAGPKPPRLIPRGEWSTMVKAAHQPACAPPGGGARRGHTPPARQRPGGRITEKD